MRGGGRACGVSPSTLSRMADASDNQRLRGRIVNCLAVNRKEYARARKGVIVLVGVHSH